MSKFFNEMTRGRNVLYPEDKTNGEKPAYPLVEEPQREPEPQLEQHEILLDASVVEAPAPVQEPYRKLEIPSDCRLRGRFEGSDWLESAEESYRALRTRLLRMRSSRQLNYVLVTSATQGEGKTLTSFNLALCCSQLPELRVLLIDSDLRTSGLTRLVGLPSGHGVEEVLTGQCQPKEAVMMTDQPNLFFLPAGHADKPAAELLAGEEWQKLLNWCGESFDLVLVDAPPVLNLADVELLVPACDGILLVVRAGHVRRDILEKSVKQLDPKKLLGLVYNGAVGRAYPRYYYEYGSSKN